MLVINIKTKICLRLFKSTRNMKRYILHYQQHTLNSDWLLLFLYITIACSCVQWPVGSCTTYLKVPPSPHKGKGADKHCDQYKEDGPSCDVGGRTHPSNSCLGREQNIHWRQVALWHRMLYVNYRNRFPRYNFRSSLYMFLYYMGCGWLL